MVQVRGSGRTGQFITGSFRLEKVKTYMRHPKEEESHLRAPQLKPLRKDRVMWCADYIQGTLNWLPMMPRGVFSYGHWTSDDYFFLLFFFNEPGEVDMPVTVVLITLWPHSVTPRFKRFNLENCVSISFKILVLHRECKFWGSSDSPVTRTLIKIKTANYIHNNTHGLDTFC